MWELLRGLLSSGPYMPHGQCYMWEPGLVRLHFFSDLTIGIAYVVISITLLRLVVRGKGELPFHWVFIAFGAFIVACGATHLMEVWTIWAPKYWLSGTVKLVTAIASVTTAVALPPVVPRAVSVIHAARESAGRQDSLEKAHRELEALYKALRKIEQQRTQFFSNVSHELRTPLSLIVGPIEKLLGSDSITAETRKELELVERNALMLLRHINDLLDLSNLEAGATARRQAFDLAKLLRVTAANFEFVAKARSITLSCDTPEKAVTEADADKMERVLLILVSTAFRSVPDGGKIDCAVSIEKDVVHVVVQDNGPGIPADEREQIFERYRQGNEGIQPQLGGLGLSLVIAKRFVELHQGNLRVSEAPGGGARFIVTLPLVAPVEGLAPVAELRSKRTMELTRKAVTEMLLTKAEAREHTASGSSPADSRDENLPLVLIVEPNPEMRNLLAESIDENCKIEVAGDGEEGLEKARAREPDLIVCAVMLPRMDGEELVRELRLDTQLRTIPVLIVTAKADADLRVRLLTGLVQDYIIKPFRREEFAARAANLLSIRKHEVELRRSHDDLRAISTRLISAQEDERKRLARDLHDDINQRLASLSMQTSLLEERTPPSVEEIMQRVHDIGHGLQNLSADIHKLSRRLHSSVLENVSLEAALRSECSDFADREGIQTEFLCDRIPDSLPADVALCVYRIAQESLQNVAKHADTGRVAVSLSGGSGGIVLSVRDFGRGFDVERSHEGLGLISMRERARPMNGRVEIRSTPGEGTEVRLQIPLAEG